MSLELVSIHFPKAAGSSLKAALVAHFGSALALDYEHDPANPDHPLGRPAALPDGARAVHGHFRGDRYGEYRNAFRFTFLREPVSTLISVYYYWRSAPPLGSPTHDRFLSEQPSIVDFARHCVPIRRLMSVTSFGGVDMGSFDFVGFHETRQRDLARLSAQLGISLLADIHENRTPEASDRQALLHDTATLATLRSLLSDDVAFYETARERWG